MTAVDHLAEIGYDPSYGARPLRRVLQRQVENELSKRLLRGEIRPATMSSLIPMSKR